ncbi:hypothetical protein N474_10010 [Pseudoalteromonas luteoviolacea CPMOR-2]|uniref:Uncharacterized protein n=1 Tax=Pseudoalteromonas luteoviolacea DSM 6061 TaxID=1365250 RepID=A0A166WZU6_9GAMM|nr:hypothetical protein [Pseudoalteromonas luteoviolacea]KZN39083.1 hypothetical protein N475_14830 [Pseudoalteromonas luteoviolacea DSM 6061]KZN56946.1 hypothetical protein N474_10010 [Pseudoalteromonas luteoviolacea CPMOR-2]MBE0389975.1 hypothetical protein [Pseudoalteromonas luteoviolacea DSM 6061]
MITLKQVSVFTLFLILFLFIFNQSSKYTINDNILRDIQSVKLRVAIDRARLSLEDPNLNYSGNEEALNEYMFSLNDFLKQKHSRVSLSEVSSKALYAQENEIVEVLSGTTYETYLRFKINDDHKLPLYIVPFIFAVLNFAVLRSISRRRFKAQIVKSAGPVVDEKPILQIDLYSKSLHLSGDKERKVQLANKPLCFYLALIEFCESNPESPLNQNKELPEELLELADKYFHRLISLGHTIRKRPNFSNSLEKTLSEIRAALDELLSNAPELKSKYYPPKAHGEGSRSKLHSYALTSVKSEDVEIIGR